LAVQSTEETDASRQLVDAGHSFPQGLGRLVIQGAQNGSPVRLNIARYHLHGVLQPPVALVQSSSAGCGHSGDWISCARWVRKKRHNVLR
jgi:hypothetical protein